MGYEIREWGKYFWVKCDMCGRRACGGSDDIVGAEMMAIEEGFIEKKGISVSWYGARKHECRDCMKGS